MIDLRNWAKLIYHTAGTDETVRGPFKRRTRVRVACEQGYIYLTNGSQQLLISSNMPEEVICRTSELVFDTSKNTNVSFGIVAS